MIMTHTDFAVMIEKSAAANKQTYVEAILEYCTDHFLEPEEIAKMIDGSLKEKIRANFVDLEMLKKTAAMDCI